MVYILGLGLIDSVLSLALEAPHSGVLSRVFRQCLPSQVHLVSFTPQMFVSDATVRCIDGL
jgi:hypothetical protein